MATTPTPGPTAGGDAFVEWLLKHKKALDYVPYALAVLLALIPLYLYRRHGWNLQEAISPVFLWGCFLAALCLVVGLTNAAYQPSDGESEADKLRYLLLALGGLGGLATVLL